jgi:hypothetical protein
MEKYIKQWKNRIIKLPTNDNSLIREQLPKYTKSIDEIVEVGLVDGSYLKKVSYTYYLPISYEKLVNQLVRERYTESEEFAILRKAVNGITDEFLIYNTYVEECKAKAKQFIAERERVINE